MILIVGLGNVGEKYQKTRHNVGFLAIDRLSELYKTSWSKERKFDAEIAQGQVDTKKLLLVKPTTYMNLSGKSIQTICSYYKINTHNMFVLHDDIDLEVARIKYKFGGGNGGHNGLKSLDQHLGKEYHRIRIGAGRPIAGSEEVSDYVLANFSKDEYQIIDSAINSIINNFHFLLVGEMDNFNKNTTQKMAK